MYSKNKFDIKKCCLVCDEFYLWFQTCDEIEAFKPLESVFDSLKRQLIQFYFKYLSSGVDAPKVQQKRCGRIDLEEIKAFDAACLEGSVEVKKPQKLITDDQAILHHHQLFRRSLSCSPKKSSHLSLFIFVKRMPLDHTELN